jgi:predicted Zn-dependent peptidase
MAQVTRLPNGLTVLTGEMPHMASTSVGLWVGVGSRHEPTQLNGVSHFIEHMMFKGTRRRTARDISEEVEGVGGYLNAFTTEENTCFYAKARSSHLAGLLDVLMDMFLNSNFEPLEIGKEREVIKEELAMYLDQPHHYVHELLNQALWPDHPLGRSLTGTEKTLDAMHRRDLVGYQQTHYVATTVLVAAAGSVQHESVVKAVKPFAPALPSGRRPGFVPFRGEQFEPCVLMRQRSTAQLQMALGIHTGSRHDERRFALRLLNTLLGENMSSRLFQTLREDRALAYSVHSSLNLFDDVGALTICAGLDIENFRRALCLIMRELRRFIRERPSATEMRRARDYLTGQLDLSLESTENQMTWLGEQFLAYGKVISPAEIQERLNKVTAGQVQKVAQDLFRPERISLAVVSPLKPEPDVAKLLRV